MPPPLTSGPAIASPLYDEFVDRYGLELLKEPGDLQIVDGDLALTKDLDFMIGDKSYNALFRLVEHWRNNTPHIQYLLSLIDRMVQRQNEADRRLEIASKKESEKLLENSQNFSRSQEFCNAWHNHYEEEGAAIFGQLTYSGCVVMLASNALKRFKNDLDCPGGTWKKCSPLYGDQSVGEILVASANGFRHEDEWAKTREKTRQQKYSIDVILSSLGPVNNSSRLPPSPGRCQEVIRLLGNESGFEGFSQSIFSFAHDIAMECRTMSQ